MCEEPCKRVTVTRVWKHGDYDDDPFSPPNNDIAIVRYVCVMMRHFGCVSRHIHRLPFIATV